MQKITIEDRRSAWSTGNYHQAACQYRHSVGCGEFSVTLSPKLHLSIRYAGYAPKYPPNTSGVAAITAGKTRGETMIEGKLRLTTVEGSGRQFVAQSGTGHALVLDDADGHRGAKPIELALLALGGCTAFDVISILRKKRQHVTGYEIELHAEQNSEPPMYFTRVEIRHKL